MRGSGAGISRGEVTRGVTRGDKNFSKQQVWVGCGDIARGDHAGIRCGDITRGGHAGKSRGDYHHKYLSSGIMGWAVLGWAGLGRAELS